MLTPKILLWNTPQLFNLRQNSFLTHSLRANDFHSADAINIKH